MTQNALDAYAMANGFGKTTAKMSEAEKVALRYKFVQEQLSAAQGDFTRTSDGWANQTRVLKLQFDSLKATLGQSFISLFTPILKGINSCLAGLQKLADGFASFISVLTGVDSKTTQFSGISSDAMDAASGIESVGDSAEKTSKKMKSIFGFDQINKIDKTEDSSTGSNSSGDVGLGSDVVPPSKDTEKATNSFAEAVKKALEPLQKISFTNLIDSLDKLKEAVRPLTEKLFSGLKKAYSKIFVPLAKWVIEDILPVFLDLLSGALKILNEILEKVMPPLQLLWDKFLEPIAKWTGGIIVEALKDIAAVIKAIGENDACISVITGLLSAFVVSKGLDKFDVFLGDINTKLSNLGTLGKVAIVITAAVVGFEVGKWLNELITGEKFELDINDYIGVNFNSDEWIDAIQYTWNDICTWCDDNIAKPVGQFFSNLWGDICNVFSDTGEWFSTKFSDAWSGIRDAFSATGDFFGGIWDNICKAFGDVAGWFKDKFSDAWEAVKNVFSSGGDVFNGIKDGILSGLKTVINSLIKGINHVVAIPFNGLNDALNTLKKMDILGAKPFSWLPTVTVPQIPKLAQGGYVKANTPQLAMIGDNRHQGEVVAPEDKLLEMATKAAQLAGGNNLNSQILTVLKMILDVLTNLDSNCYIDGELITDKITRIINNHTRQTGVCEITT